MKTTINHIASFIVFSFIAAIFGIAVATGLNPSTVYANHEFAANLTGQQEVPPVDTQATGQVILVQNMSQNQTVPYFVNVTGI